MRVAIYARVSTNRQSQTQSLEQQLQRLQEHAQQQGWTVEDEDIYRDDGYSGASLNRPGLERLRDRAAWGEIDRVLITVPDRLARHYVHQVLLIEELEQHGGQVEFLDRPMSQDPHDQLLLQIRGAVAEYERSLIAERMRRGRLAKLKAGQLLPWSTPPFGYQVDPDRPRDPQGVRIEPFEAQVVQQIFEGYLEAGGSLRSVARQLTDDRIRTPRGNPHWNTASVRNILKNFTYTGTLYANRMQQVPAQRRLSALRPVGPGKSRITRPPEEWISIAVPAIVSQETFDRVQAKFAQNQRCASRNNTRNKYLLRGLVSCGQCRMSATGRAAPAGYFYYACVGRTDGMEGTIGNGPRCSARYVPAGALDELVWQDLGLVLTEPEHLAQALERAHGGGWLPQELQARQTQVQQALVHLERQRERLLEAYLAGVLELAELERKRTELAQRGESLEIQQQQLETQVHQRLKVSEVAASMEEFCAQVRQGLAQATFPQRRALVELLIDRVIVTEEEVEIRYVVPTSPKGPHSPFCHLRLDH